MPLLAVAAVSGLLGVGTGFVVSDGVKSLFKVALIGGGAYVAYNVLVKK